MKKLDKNYLCSIIYGIFGSLGFICLVNFVMMTAIDFKSENHPYSYPFCIIAGFLSLIICIAAFCANINFLSDTERKAKTILKEFAFALIIFIACIFLWNGLWSAVSGFLKFMEW